MYVEVYHLTATEGIELLQTKHHLRSGTSVDFVAVVCLDIRLVGFVEHTAHGHIKRVTRGCGVARSKGELHGTVLSGIVQLVGTLQEGAVAIHLFGEKAQLTEKQARTDLRFLAVEKD